MAASFNKSDITIVIVSYYRGDRLKKCLDTIDPLVPVIVWDNNTTGDELEKIKIAEKSHPKSNFIYSKENVGLTKAWNQGIIKSQTDWVLLTCDDMIFDSDWLEVLNDILEKNPHLEQVHLNAWNAVAFHKKTIVRIGWWDEGYRYYPSMEDDDWFLRCVEVEGHSPYGSWYENKNFLQFQKYPNYIEAILPHVDAKKEYFQKPNLTYFCNSKFSQHKIIGLKTNTGQELDAGSRNKGEGSMDRGNNMTGVEYHHLKWKNVDPRIEKIDNKRVLLGKDGRCWVRMGDDYDYYPQYRAEYAMKYFNVKI